MVQRVLKHTDNEGVRQLAGIRHKMHMVQHPSTMARLILLYSQNATVRHHGSECVDNDAHAGSNDDDGPSSTSNVSGGGGQIASCQVRDHYALRSCRSWLKRTVRVCSKQASVASAAGTLADVQKNKQKHSDIICGLTRNTKRSKRQRNLVLRPMQSIPYKPVYIPRLHR